MAVLFLVLVMLINVAVNFAVPGPPYCWEFDDVSLDGWTGTGFTSSLSETPDTVNIPGWTPPTDYAYVQSDTPDTEKTGRLTMPFTINDGDVISAMLYRHVVVVDDTDRITVSFITDGLTTVVLQTSVYDNWDEVQIRCGTDYISCCTSYPCKGEFQIDGDVFTTDELVGVDYVGLNSGCDPLPPPPPPPGPYDCNFDSSVCGWSLETSSDGWHWSLGDGFPDPVKHPSFPPPSSPYIWAQDATTTVTSEIIIIPVNETTVFSLDYYFETSSQGVDSFEVMFVDTVFGERPPFISSFYDSGAWEKANFSSPTICADPLLPFCTGTLQISTKNVPFNKLLLAIDNFVVTFTV